MSSDVLGFFYKNFITPFKDLINMNEAISLPISPRERGDRKKSQLQWIYHPAHINLSKAALPPNKKM